MRTTCLASLILLSLMSTAASAEYRLSLADRDDEYIYKLTEMISVFVEDYETPPSEGAVILKQDFYMDMSVDENVICENYVLYVFNPDAPHVSEQSLKLPRGRAMQSYGGWIYRADGTLERLGEDQIKVLNPGDGQPVEVLFPFPAVREGDMLAWSVASKADGILFRYGYQLSNVFPTKYAIVYLISDGNVGYRMAAHNVKEDAFASEVKAEKNGAPSQVKFTFIDIPADVDEAYGLPFSRREPYLELAYRGGFRKDLGQWHYVKSWSQLAYVYDDYLSRLLNPSDPVRQKARALTASATNNQARTEALYRFTRDEFINIPVQYRSGAILPPEMALEATYIDDFDQAILLATLIRSVDGSARIGFVHSANAGSFDQNYPNLVQFDAAVVESPVGSGTWYDPSCRVCPAGQLPVELQGAKTYLPEVGLEEESGELWNRVGAKVGGNEKVFWQRYFDEMSREPWYSFATLPSSAAMLQGTTTETTTHDLETGVSDVHITSTGFTSAAMLFRIYPTHEELGTSYLQRRWDAGKLESSAWDGDEAEREQNHLELDLRFDPEASATLAGDVCILTPELVFGTMVLPGWDGPERDVFHVPTLVRNQYQWSMTLPDGWIGLDAPLFFQREFGPLQYSASVSVESGALTILRSLSLQATTLYEENLNGLDETIQAIRDFESQSIIVEKNPGT